MYAINPITNPIITDFIPKDPLKIPSNINIIKKDIINADQNFIYFLIILYS